MLSSTLLELLSANEKVDRIVLPTLRTMNLLLRNDYLKCLFEAQTDGTFPSFGTSLFTCLQEQLRSSDVKELCVCVDLLVLLCASGGPLGGSRSSHSWAYWDTGRFPRVRKCAAEQLYVLLVSDPAAVGERVGSAHVTTTTSPPTSTTSSVSVCGLVGSRESLEGAQELILGTVWDAAISHVRYVKT